MLGGPFQPVLYQDITRYINHIEPRCNKRLEGNIY